VRIHSYQFYELKSTNFEVWGVSGSLSLGLIPTVVS
jgi:hypothetical protein